MHYITWSGDLLLTDIPENLQRVTVRQQRARLQLFNAHMVYVFVRAIFGTPRKKRAVLTKELVR